MFRHKPTSPPTPAEPVEPINGLFFNTDQTQLTFGSDRAVPINKRPTLCLRKEDPFVIALPATSKKPYGSNRDAFYPLDPAKNEVMWNRKEERKTYVHYRYETLNIIALGEKIGVVPQPVRIAIARWQNDFSQPKQGIEA